MITTPSPSAPITTGQELTALSTSPVTLGSGSLKNGTEPSGNSGSRLNDLLPSSPLFFDCFVQFVHPRDNLFIQFFDIFWRLARLLHLTNLFAKV